MNDTELLPDAVPSTAARNIYLTRGYVALVSPEDFEALSKFKWCFDGLYAQRGLSKIKGKQRKLRMHRVILPGAVEIDHINGNKLDNRRVNLRAVGKSENTLNRGKLGWKKITSKYMGVSKGRDGVWRARFMRDKFNSTHKTEIEAALARDSYVIKSGVIAPLNFPNWEGERNDN